MQKPKDTTKGCSGAATTVIVPRGAISAEPKLEEPAKPATRRVLGMQVEVLPSKYDSKAEKPFFFHSAEEYADLEKNPVSHLIRRALDKTVVKFVAIAGAIGAPFVQIYLNDKINLGLYSYFSQQVENFSNIFSGAYEYSLGIFLGFAAAVATVALSIPFVSNKPREDSICLKEQEHPSEEVRKAHKSTRRAEQAFRMISKFRGASFLAAIPLAASDFWAYASGGFKGAGEFVQGMSTPAQAAIGAFLALTISSFISAKVHNKAVLTAADKEYAHNVAGEAANDARKRTEEAEAAAAYEAEADAIIAPLEEAAAADRVRAAEGIESAGLPANVVNLSEKRAACGVQPATEAEANTLEGLYSAIMQRDAALEERRAHLQVLAEQLGLANAARAVLDRKLLSQEKAVASLEENKGLKKSLDVKANEISLLNSEIEKLAAEKDSLEGDRDILAKEKERIIREREGYAKSHDEKERLLNLATGLLSQREKELAELKAQLAAAKSAKPGPVSAPVSAVIQVPAPAVAQAPAEPVAAKEAPAPKEESVSLSAAPLEAAAEPRSVPQAVAAAESPAAAAPEPLRGSPSEGGLPATVTDSPADAASEEPDDYNPGGPAVLA